ncbi:MAG: Zn-dependent alcohol dehydrogenase [Rhodovibrionaceae bacterium]|nr:Zn-dependent alcohol dehydrogenase [Rhodovibrionaceae bacterium]
MKAAVCREFGKPLVIEEVSLDPPGTGEVRVRTAACAICHSDIIAMDGGWGGVLPSIYGHEAAGVVTATGPGVTGLEVGDHVVATLLRSCGTCHFCGQDESFFCEGEFALDREHRLHDAAGGHLHQGLRTGAFAEELVVDRSQVAVIPHDLPLDSASLLACGVITGLGAVTNTARVPAGASVAVIGCGGVGLNSVQGAALSGAEPIIALDTVNEKLDAALTFGAGHGVNPTREDATAKVRQLTGGRGADFAFVTVGSKAAIEASLKLVRRGGTVVVVGMPASGVMAEFEAAEFAGDGLKILGSKMGSTRLDVDIPALVELYRSGRLKLDELVSGRFALDEINEAIAAIRAGRSLRNVIVFDATATGPTSRGALS